MRRKVQKVGINFGTIAEALAAAKVGDLVQVLPGVYEEEGLQLKNGVNIEFLPGAELNQSQDSIDAEEEYIAFTDGGEDITCSISGHPTFNFYGASELLELTGVSQVSMYGKGSYIYTNTLTWLHADKITFDSTISPRRSSRQFSMASLSFTVAGAADPVNSLFELKTQDVPGLAGVDSANDFNYGDPFDGVNANSGIGAALDIALAVPGDVVRDSVGHYDIQLGNLGNTSTLGVLAYSTDPAITMVTPKYVIATNTLRVSFRNSAGVATDIASGKKCTVKVMLWIG